MDSSYFIVAAVISLYFTLVQEAPVKQGVNVCFLQERVPDSPSPAPSLDDGRRSGSHLSSRPSSSVSSSPAHTESSSDRPRMSFLQPPMILAHSFWAVVLIAVQLS